MFILLKYHTVKPMLNRDEVLAFHHELLHSLRRTGKNRI